MAKDSSVAAEPPNMVRITVPPKPRPGAASSVSFQNGGCMQQVVVPAEIVAGTVIEVPVVEIMHA